MRKEEHEIEILKGRFKAATNEMGMVRAYVLYKLFHALPKELSFEKGFGMLINFYIFELSKMMILMTRSD